MSMRNELDDNQFLDTRRIGGTHILVVTLLILTMMVDGYDIFVVGTVAPYLAADFAIPPGALTSVLAVRLVQLKTLARAEPDLPAEHVVPKPWLTMLRALRKRPQISTVRDFFRHLAGLGGFLLRKRDGEPGWITIWRGLDKLLLALRGYTAMQRRCG